MSMIEEMSRLRDEFAEKIEQSRASQLKALEDIRAAIDSAHDELIADVVALYGQPSEVDEDAMAKQYPAPDRDPVVTVYDEHDD